MRGLTDADLAERMARARLVLGSDSFSAGTAQLAGDVVALVVELRWWRENYGTEPVPFMPAAAGAH